VYASIVVASFAGLQGSLFAALSVTVLGARVCQTLVHVGFAETERAVSVRFTFFAVQLSGMPWIAFLVSSLIGVSPSSNR
jgi:energy-converting hydrogenase Eha subunit B